MLTFLFWRRKMSHEQSAPASNDPWFVSVWRNLQARLSDQLAAYAVTALIALFGLIGTWVWGFLAGGGFTRSSIPSGAVVAFNANECPKGLGWRDYWEGTGRFVVGAGKTISAWRRVNPDGSFNGALQNYTTHPLNERGGEENHILSKAELPADPVSFVVVPVNKAKFGFGESQESFDIFVGEKPGVSPGSYETRISKPIGEGAPHNIMPPFIALTYCVKE
jgi:hypothetical protein